METPCSSRRTAASLNSLLNCLRANPMTQFSIRWNLSLNHLSQNWGQVQLPWAKNDEYYDGVDSIDNRFTMLESPDRRHKLNVTGIYELPFGRGHKFAGNMNKVADLIAGGWAVSGIYQYISGAYLRFGGLQFNGGDPKLDSPTRNQWFDTSKFSLLPAFTRRANPLQFDGLTGPRISTIDATMSKNIKLNERVSMEFRMEAYNLANVMVQGDPNLSVTSSLFGRINGQRGAYFGRQIQYNARIRF